MTYIFSRLGNSLSTPLRVGYLSICVVFGVCALNSPIHAQTKKYAFDPAKLNHTNFYQVLEPLAKREGKLVLYNFAGNFDPVWKNGLIPRFEQRYGIKVQYSNVRNDQANQQLIAVHKAGAPSPVDVYFAGGSDNYEVLQAAGVIASLKLSQLLPNLGAVPSEYKDVVFGVDTHGRWPIFHRNQVALGYDSELLQNKDVPTSFDALLKWAERNPKKFALTSPTKGGSGKGFLYSAAMHFVTDAACRQTLTNYRMTQEQAAQWAADATCLAPLWAYMNSLMKVAELTNGNADTLNLINNKQIVIGTVWEDQSMTFVRGKQLPASFRLTLLQKGLINGGDGLILTANAQSPAAALLFMDMAFSKEFQTWKLEHHASRSSRSDVEVSGNVTAETARYLVPAAQGKGWTIPANWIVSGGLARVFEDKILNKP